MKILFTGTGSGKTSLDRFHSSFVIQSEDCNLLVDAGDGISKALLSAKVDFRIITSILFTHMHPDHSAGLPSLISQMKMADREEDLIIYCHNNHRTSLLNLLHYTLILPERLKFKLVFKTFPEGEKISAGNSIEFICRLNSHLADLSEDLSESERVSCSYLFNLNHKILFYTGDILIDDDLYLFEDQKIDIIIAESTHLDANLITDAFRKSGASHLYLTHIREEEKPEVNLPGVSVVYDKYEIAI